MNKSKLNQYKKAHKDMIDYCINNNMQPQDYLDHLLVQQDQGCEVFMPLDDLLYYPCSYAFEAYQECLSRGILIRDKCDCCLFSLNPKAAWSIKNCDWWTEIPRYLKYCNSETDYKLWKKDMRAFRNLKWNEKWIDT